MNRLFQDENRKEKKKIIPQGRARTNIANSFPGIRVHACLFPFSPHSIHRSQNNWHQPTNAMTMRQQLENFAAPTQRELLASLG